MYKFTLQLLRKVGIPAILLFAIIFCCVSIAHAQDSRPSREYQIKASLIFNFIQYIEWPPEVWNSDPLNIHVCIVGTDRFGVALTALERELIRGKHLAISHIGINEIGDLRSCHVAFISRDTVAQAAKVLSVLERESVFTIGESAQFLEQGGIVNIAIEDDKVVFDVNQAAALRARLNISSKLLRIARVVKENG